MRLFVPRYAIAGGLAWAITAALATLSNAVADPVAVPALIVNQPLTQAQLKPGEGHAYRISIANAGRYVIASEGYTQVSLALFGPGDATKRVDFRAAGRTVATPDLVNLRLNGELTPGEYVLRVESGTAGGAGEYGIRIAAADGGGFPETKPQPDVGPNFRDGPFLIDKVVTKIALLVGINRYQNVVLAPELGGCENDVDDMRDLLVQQFRFPPSNVLRLKSNQATRQNIIAAFRQHLIERARLAQAGEAQSICCVFHYSGHGGRMTDAEPFKDETDGKDETLIPYDSGTPGVFDITDDEIYLLSAELAKYARNVTFVFDSCHSGDLMKGVGQRRTVEWVANPSPRPFYDDPAQAIPTTPPADLNDLRDNRQYAFIAGSQEQQSSYEIERGGLWRGSLTYFLTAAIRGARPAAGDKVTYRAVMEQVKANVHGEYQSQKPYVSGEKLDDVIFGDESFRPGAFTYARLGAAGFDLLAGQLHGVTPGSRYDVYPPLTTDFDDPSAAVARIAVTSVATQQSQAAIDERVPPDRLAPQTPPAEFRAIERLHVYGADAIPLAIAATPLSALARIRTHLATSEEFQGQFRFVESGTARLVIEEQAGQILLTRGGEKDPFSTLSAADPELLTAVGKEVYAWSRWDSVRQITNPHSRLQVEFTLVPQMGTPRPPPAAGDVGIRLYDGGRCLLTIVNRGEKRVLINLLEIDSTGSVEPKLANAELARDALYEAIVDFDFPANYRENSYYSMLKLFVTEQKIDVQPLLVRGTKSKGDDSPLSRLLHRAGFANKDGTLPVKADDWLTIAQEVELVRIPAATSGRTRFKPRPALLRLPDEVAGQPQLVLQRGHADALSAVERRVESLYAQIQRGEVRGVAGAAPRVVFRPRNSNGYRDITLSLTGEVVQQIEDLGIQRPALFDFRQRKVPLRLGPTLRP